MAGIFMVSKGMVSVEITFSAAILLGIIYFVPTIVAFNRQHRRRNSISALNLFLGWTFIGWVAALVWALTNERS